MNAATSAPYLVAQLTDLHIKAGGKMSYRMVDTAGALHTVIDTLLAAPQLPDIVVVTGDLVDFGDEHEYRFLRDILQRLPMPIRLLPGNHDHRASLRRVFADHDYLFAYGDGDEDAPTHYAMDAGPLRLVGFDCTMPGRPGGRAEPDGLAWLDAALAAAPAQPTLVRSPAAPLTSQRAGGSPSPAPAPRKVSFFACCAARTHPMAPTSGRPTLQWKILTRGG